MGLGFRGSGRVASGVVLAVLYSQHATLGPKSKSERALHRWQDSKVGGCRSHVKFITKMDSFELPPLLSTTHYTADLTCAGRDIDNDMNPKP